MPPALATEPGGQLPPVSGGRGATGEGRSAGGGEEVEAVVGAGRVTGEAAYSYVFARYLWLSEVGLYTSAVTPGQGVAPNKVNNICVVPKLFAC